MCPSWARVRSLCVDVEPGLVAAKLTLLGMRGRFLVEVRTLSHILRSTHAEEPSYPGSLVVLYWKACDGWPSYHGSPQWQAV